MHLRIAFSNQEEKTYNDLLLTILKSLCLFQVIFSNMVQLPTSIFTSLSTTIVYNFRDVISYPILALFQ